MEVPLYVMLLSCYNFLYQKTLTLNNLHFCMQMHVKSTSKEICFIYLGKREMGYIFKTCSIMSDFPQNAI
jgi:hypothetical protein